MNIKQFLKENIVCLDGGMGTLLQEAGLPLGELPERWNITHASEIRKIHYDYFNAGSNLVLTNTFGANFLKFKETELREIIQAAVENAKIAAETSMGAQKKFIALDIGPLGKLLKPYGDLAFEKAVEIFATTVKIGTACGVDAIVIETMNDSLECKAAVLAAKENSDLPIFVSCAFGEDGKLMTGATPTAMVAMLEGLGVDALGVNCSVGPVQMEKVVEELLQNASVPVWVKPNAGLPIADGGTLRYDIDKEEFSKKIADFVKKGARMVGGCCGTTPEYIVETVKRVKELSVLPIVKKGFTCVSSYTHSVSFDSPVLIGERINPTGKKRFKQALKERELGYILSEAVTQQEKGVHILDVNVGAPEVDEKTELPYYLEEIQAVVDLPLQIDTSDYVAMERALRIYNGKPLVNSVNGKKESMEAVFPLVKKYGGVVVALTLNEQGIPETAEGRLQIAQNIIQTAVRYGIDKKDIIVDPLAMAVSADKNAAQVTLKAIQIIKKELGVKTSLGVSNISFGLPARDTINAAFYAMALQNGLDCAILNPNSIEMLKVYNSFIALNGKDEAFEKYISFASSLPETVIKFDKSVSSMTVDSKSALKSSIIKGLTQQSAVACEELLSGNTALYIVEKEIIPALDEVGKAYEEKRAFLPQLLMSAEAAKAAFEVLKKEMLSKGVAPEKKCKIVLATVHGDIHDIGKNIVATLLENYAFEVIDLGRDVPSEQIVEKVLETKAPLVGLSALMTTTLPSMAQTIQLLKEKAPDCKVMVGGAVLTQEYAEKIGADSYSKDGMGAVRYAESIYKLL